MGKLIEETIAALHGGVSRQPASVRRAEQVEEGTNALFSVVTGGFQKRPPTSLITKLTGLTAGSDYSFHSIDRTATEQYFITIDPSGVGSGGADICVIDSITGTGKTLTVADSSKYFLVEQDGIDGTGVVDDSDSVDIVVKSSWDSAETAFSWNYVLSDSGTIFKIEGSADGSTGWTDIATAKTGASGSFSTTIGAAATGDHNYIRVNITNAAGAGTDTITLYATFKDTSYLTNGTTSTTAAGSAALRFATVADTTVVVNVNTKTRMRDADSGSITSTVQTFADLPTAAADSSTHHIIGDDSDGFGSYYVIDDTGSVYTEIADPTAHNNFDASAMPHLIVRNSDESFTFKQATWGARPAGDEESIPVPDFITLTINDVAFYRNRLALIADEVVYTSRAGDLFELFPQKATQVLDDDPVSRAASSTEINILERATVFRKILFTTSRRAQFELSSNAAFTPESAIMDLATSYTASTDVAPTVMGDQMYFAGSGFDHTVLYEYRFDEASLSNTAADVTKHVQDYVPDNIIQLKGDASSGTLFALSSDEQNALYTYRTFFDGSEKLQSAWAKYTFGATESAAFIHGFDVIDGYLVLLIEREDGFIYLEQAPIEEEAADATMNFAPHLDQKESVTGTYDSGEDVTHWDLSFEHNDDVSIVSGNGFGANSGASIPAYYPSRYTLTLATVLAAETIIINGLTYTAHASTTTVANREFDISGNDTADAGELTTCINDATYGVPGVTATDNADGTITLNMDDKGVDDGITAPTGTAITNSTITAVELNDLTAALGDWSADVSHIGRDYEMDVQLSEVFVKQDARTTGSGRPSIITGRLQLKDFTFNLVDTGYMTCEVTNETRPGSTYVFSGQIIGENAAVGTRDMETQYWRVPIWGNAQKVTVHLKNDSPFPSKVASAAWRGFFSELTRQE